MTRQIRSKRAVAIIIVLVIALSLSSQAYAAPWDKVDTSPGGGRPAGNFSRPTGMMNALFGGSSAPWPASSGTLPPNSSVTGVTFTFTVSSGSNPCYIWVESPLGPSVRSARTYGPGSYTASFTNFNGQDPTGTWYVWIETTGTVSTATGTLQVNYFYP